MEAIFRELAELKRRVAELETRETPGVWTTWTPTITQSVSVTFTTVYAFYTTFQGKVLLAAQLSVTGTGTSGNAIVISGVPAAVRPQMAAGSMTLVGSMHILDSGVAYYSGSLVYVGTDDWRGLHHNAANYLGIVPAFGLVNGDAISLLALYRQTGT